MRMNNINNKRSSDGTYLFDEIPTVFHRPLLFNILNSRKFIIFDEHIGFISLSLSHSSMGNKGDINE